MIRNKVLAVAAAAGVFVLAACSGSTAGTATPATSPATTSVSPTTAPTVPTTSAETGAPTAGTTAAPTTEEQESTPATSAESTPAETTSEAPTTGEQTTGGGETADSATITVGGNVDAQTANWFSTFCSGVGPTISAFDNSESDLTDQSDPTKMQQSLYTAFGKFGQALTDTAAKLKNTPPPTFANGAQFASDFVQAMSSVGPKMVTAAQKIQAADTSDPDKFESVVEDALSGVGDDMDSLDKYTLDDNTQAALASIPACAPFINAETDTTTTG